MIFDFSTSRDQNLKQSNTQIAFDHMHTISLIIHHTQVAAHSYGTI